MPEVSAVDDLSFVTTLARSRSLSAAAREWGVSLSAVSKRLRRIETRLGVQLAVRTSHGLHLTPAGERYAEGADHLIRGRETLESLVAQESTELRGRVAVHATLGLGRRHVAPLLSALSGRHPGLEIDLTISEMPVNIANSGHDIAVRVGPPPDSRLHLRRLHANRKVLVASPAYLARRGTPRQVGDLAEHDCIVLKENGADYALWRLGTPDQAVVGIRVNGPLISNDGDVIVRWCLEGRGVILRSIWHVGPLLRRGLLVEVLPEVAKPPSDIYGLVVADRHLPGRIELVLDELGRGLRERIPVW